MAEKVISLKLVLKGQDKTIQELEAVTVPIQESAKLLDSLNAKSQVIKDLTKLIKDLAKQLAAINKANAAAGRGGGSGTGGGSGSGNNQANQQANDLAARIKAARLEQQKLRNELSELGDASSDRYKELVKLIAEYKAKQAEVTTELRRQAREFEASKFAAGSYKDLNFQLGKARDLYRQLSIEQRRGAEGKALLENIQRLDRELKSIDKEMGIFTRNVGNYQSALNGLQEVTTRFFAITGAAIGVEEIISNNAEISDSIADVAKTANSTIADVQQLSEELKFRDTRTSIADQLGIAKIGGQLGVAQKDLASFTGAVDVLNVALGDQFGGDVEVLTDQVGRLRNTLTTFKTDNVADDILKIGNALNVLEADGVATAANIVEISSRLSGLSQALGLNAGEIIGISATLDELNIAPERAGTAIQKVLSEVARTPAVFAQVAKKSTKEFTELVNTDLVGAFTAVLDGINGNKSSTTEFIKILDGLGLEGERAIEVFSKLAGSTDLLKQRIVQSNEELTKTDSLYAEFNKKNQTLGAGLEKTKNALINLTVNSKFQDFLAGILLNLAKFINGLSLLPKLINDNKTEILFLAAAILSLNQSLIFSSLAAIRASAAYQLMTSATARQALATKLLGQAMKSLPILLVVAAIYAMVKAIQAYSEGTTIAAKVSKSLAQAQKEIAEETANEIGALNRSIEVLKNDAFSKEEKKKAIDALLQQYPEYLRGIDLETASVGKLNTIQKELTENIIKSAAERKKATLQDEQTAKIVEARLELQRIQRQGFSAFGTFDSRRFRTDPANIERKSNESGESFAVRKAKEDQQAIIKEAEAAILEIDKQFGEAFDKVVSIRDRALSDREKAERERDDRQVNRAKKSAEIVITSAADMAKAEKEADKEAKQREEERLKRIKEAADNIRRLQLEALQKTFEGRKQLARENADDEIKALVGTPEQVETQTNLIKAKLVTSIAEIEKEFQAARARALEEIESFRQQISEGTASFRLTGAQNELAASERFYKQETNLLKLSKAQQLAELETSLSKGLITVDQFNARRLEAERSFQSKNLALLKMQNAETAVNEAELLARQLEQRETAFRAELAQIEKQRLERKAAILAQSETGAITSAEATSGIQTSDALSTQEQLDAEQKYLAERDAMQSEFATKQIERAIDVSEQETAIVADKNQKLIALQEQYNAILIDSVGTISQAFGEFLTGQEKDGKAFLKNILTTSLDALEKLILLQVASAQAQSLAQPDSIATFGATGIARAAILTGLIKAAFGGLKGLIASFEKGGAIPGTGASGEGVAQGPSHAGGGIPIRVGRSLAVIEGGEHVLKNGRETYIINKKSSRQFSGPLRSLQGNGNRYNPMKRAMAEAINVAGGGRPFGKPVRFADGGAFAVNALAPPQIDRGIGVAFNQMTGLAGLLKDQITATNERIDRLTVVANPAQLAREGARREDLKRAKTL